MTFWKLLGLTALFAGTTIATVPHAAAQTASPPVAVVPLARSAAFSFRLDEVAPSLFSPTVPAPWMEVGRRAILEWRAKDSSAWKSAQDFVRVQHDRWNIREVPDPRMATMLFGLIEGHTYEYRVRFEGTGYPKTSFTGQFTTLTTDVPHGNAATITLTPTTPNLYQAIKAALGATSTPQTNKVIEIAGTAPGVRTIIRKPISSYYETNSYAFMWKGTADGWLTLQTKTGDDVVFDGSDPDYDVTNANKWIRYTDAMVTADQDIYRTAVKFYDPANPNAIYSSAAVLRPKPVMVYYETAAGGDGWRLQDVSVGNKCSDPGGNPVPLLGISTLASRASETPNEGAFCADAGYVYVHLHNGIDPNRVYMKIPVLTSALDLSTTEYLRIKNIKMQYFRGNGDSRFGGLHMDNVSNIVIEGCEFKGLGTCLGMRVSFSSIKNSIVIKNNRFLQRGLYPEQTPATGKWLGTRWEHMKMSKEEDYGIMIRGFGISILDNTFIGMFNGVTNMVAAQGNPPVYGPTNPAYGENYEIDNNSFMGINDDCLEMETWAVCVAATRNRMTRSYKGWSIAPLEGGPQYFLRNTWVGRGEYGASAYKQAMTKFGNDDPGDTAYKMMANNTSINVNDDPNGRVLVGISASGASYNTYIYNNYIACDAYPIEWGDGSLGYPHLFNGNRYVVKRMATAFPGYGTSNCVGIGRVVPRQGEDANNAFHVSRSWNDWQMGKDVRNGYNYPGYQASPTDLSAYLHSTHSVVLPWMHDPDSKFSEGTHTLTDPLRGDFKPVPGSDAVGVGVPLANITVDCGPGWAAYEEPGRCTAGAVPGVGGTMTPNLPPTVSLPQALTGAPSTPLKVDFAYADPDGTITAVTTAVSDSAGESVPSVLANPGAGSASVTFTPPAVGTFRVVVVATDDKAASTVGQTDIVISPTQLPGGSITISVTPSTRNARPGEPVIYTVNVDNPTSRTIKDVILKQLIPAQVTLNVPSAMLDGKPAKITVGSGYFTLPLGDMPPNARHTITVTTVIN